MVVHSQASVRVVKMVTAGRKQNDLYQKGH